MMTPAEIAAMQADAEKGTPGPWVVYNMATIISPDGDAEIGNWHVASASWSVDARRIARVPIMETTIIAQAAEIERLRLLTQTPGRV